MPLASELGVQPVGDVGSPGELSAAIQAATVNQMMMRKAAAERAADPEKARASSRAAYLKYRDKYLARAKIRGRQRRTGVDNQTYLALWALQDGKCAVCRHALDEKRAHTDHCHDSGKPRGILCPTCNQAEGMIKRTGLGAEEFGKRLAGYLAHPPAKEID